MKYYFLLALLLASITSFSQEIIGHIITNKRKKINMYKNVENKVKGRMYHILYGDMNLTGEYVRYYDENNKLKKFSQSKVENLVYGEKRFITLPIMKRVKRVHEVIAENDNYLLTEYYSYGGFYFYVFDKSNLKPKLEKLPHSLFKENDLKIIEMVKTYFPNCTDLIDIMTGNMENWETKKEKTSVGTVTAYIPEESEKGNKIPNRILSDGLIEFKCK